MPNRIRETHLHMLDIIYTRLIEMPYGIVWQTHDGKVHFPCHLQRIVSY